MDLPPLSEIDGSNPWAETSLAMSRAAGSSGASIVKSMLIGCERSEPLSTTRLSESPSESSGKPLMCRPTAAASDARLLQFSSRNASWSSISSLADQIPQHASCVVHHTGFESRYALSAARARSVAMWYRDRHDGAARALARLQRRVTITPALACSGVVDEKNCRGNAVGVFIGRRRIGADGVDVSEATTR